MATLGHPVEGGKSLGRRLHRWLSRVPVRLALLSTRDLADASALSPVPCFLATILQKHLVELDVLGSEHECNGRKSFYQFMHAADVGGEVVARFGHAEEDKIRGG